MGRRTLLYVWKVAVIAALYFCLGKLAMEVSVVCGTISTIWPASGLAVGVLLRFGKGVWPGILLGATLASYVPGVPIWVTLTVGVANTLSALLAFYLMQHFCSSGRFFEQIRNVLRFTLFAGLISPLVDTVIGVGSLYFSGRIQAADFVFACFSWWVGGATGVIVVAPLLLTWLDHTENWKRPAEFVALLSMVILTSHLIFGGWMTGNVMESLTFKFLLLPYYVWLVFRFGPREIGTTTVFVAGVAFLNTLLQFGTVKGVTLNELLLSLEAFVSFIMVAALVLNAMVTERRRMIADLARLEKLNLVGQMAAGIAHEIRNPMTTVRGFLQMLANNPKNNLHVEFFDLMINELDRANSMITEYLMLARNRTTELKLQSINEIIKVLEPLIVADALNADKYVEVYLGDVPNLPLDAKEITQLILNLIRNGLEAMGPKGKLTIQTCVEKDNVVVSIKDEGKGIDPQVLKNLGTPFLTTKENGTGLGLAVSYSIAARHGAVIKVDTSSSGTTFKLKFIANSPLRLCVKV